MAELEKLLKQLRTAEKKEDLDRLDKVRQRILDEHGDAPVAAETRYRLGLSKLLRHGQPKEAEPLFLAAAQSGHATYAPMARISYALLLHAQRREQKALFELRKVVGARKPTPHSTVALAFIVTILGDTGAAPDEIGRARKQQIEHLRALLEEVDAAEARAQLSLQLGLALADHGDAAGARQALEGVVKAEDVADHEVVDQAKAALATL